MRYTDVLKMDGRGRIVIPLQVRTALGLVENMELMLIADTNTKEINIYPFPVNDSTKMYKFDIEMEDRPGALATIATIFSQNKVDLLFGESRIISRRKKAHWSVIADFSDSLKKPEEIVILLKESGATNYLTFSRPIGE